MANDLDRTIEKLKRETQTKSERQAENTVSELESVVRASHVQLSKRSEKIKDSIKEVMEMQAGQSAKEIRKSMKTLSQFENEIRNIEDDDERHVLKRVLDKSKKETQRKSSIGRTAAQHIGSALKNKIPKPGTIAVGAAGLTGSPALLGLTSFFANRAQNVRERKREERQQEREDKKRRLEMFKRIQEEQKEKKQDNNVERVQAKRIEEQTTAQNRQVKKTDKSLEILTRIRDILEIQLTEEQRNNLKQIEQRRERKRLASSLPRDEKGRFLPRGSQQRTTGSQNQLENALEEAGGGLGVGAGIGLTTRLGSILRPIKGLLRGVVGLGSSLGSVIGSSTTVTSGLSVLKMVGKLFAGLAPLKAGFDSVMELIETGSMSKALEEFFGSLFEFISFGLIEKTDFKSNLDFGRLAEPISDAFWQLVKGFKQILANPREGIRNILGGIGNIGNVIGEGVAQLLLGKTGKGGLFSAMTTMFENFDLSTLSGVGNLIKSIVDTVLNWTGQLIAGILDFVGLGDIGDRVAKFFQGSPINKLMTAIKGAYDTIAGFFTETIPFMFKHVFSNAVDWIKSIPQKIINMLPSSVASFLGLEQTNQGGPDKTGRQRQIEALEKGLDNVRAMEAGRKDTALTEEELDQKRKDMEAELERLRNQSLSSGKTVEAGLKRSLHGGDDDELGQPLHKMPGLRPPSEKRTEKMLNKMEENRQADEAKRQQPLIFNNQPQTNNVQKGGDGIGQFIAPTTTRNNESAFQRITEKDFESSM